MRGFYDIRWVFMSLLGGILLLGCVQKETKLIESNNQLEALYTVQAEGSHAFVRAIIKAKNCPTVQFDKHSPVTMRMRVEAAVIPTRRDNGQPQVKEAAFDVSTCEMEWPVGAKSARVQGQYAPAPKQINRIVIVSDTGCRMKASDNGFQACNDESRWPFAQVVKSAAMLKPDLVLHLGDINYRESPCPEGNNGCSKSPWGYGFDTWNADLFIPAKPLLTAAPWVFVRGNHESCARAGQGWFRFLDTQPWTEARSCNSPNKDIDADYSEPYAVSISKNLELIIFDSSKAPAKALNLLDNSFIKYSANMQKVSELTKQKSKSFFLSHHPVLGFGLPEKGDKGNSIKPGNAALQSVMKLSEPQRLFPQSVDIAISGHVHLFETIGFSSAHPATLVMGNSGSLNEGKLPDVIPAGVEPYPGAVVNDFVTMADFGFATLDRLNSEDDSLWLLTEYTASGVPVYRCNINNGKSNCKRL